MTPQVTFLRARPAACWWPRLTVESALTSQVIAEVAALTGTRLELTEAVDAVSRDERMIGCLSQRCATVLANARASGETASQRRPRPRPGCSQRWLAGRTGRS